MFRKDRVATERAGFLDPKSFVAPDGRERLYGKDWKARKLEIWNRGSGCCEKIVAWKDDALTIPIRCRSEMHDPHHIIPRSKGRDDRAKNLIGLCRLHHDSFDPRRPRLKWIKDN